MKNKMIEGIIIGRRSMGRNLAFADIFIVIPTGSTIFTTPARFDDPRNLNSPISLIDPISATTTTEFSATTAMTTAAARINTPLSPTNFSLSSRSDLTNSPDDHVESIKIIFRRQSFLGPTTSSQTTPTNNKGSSNENEDSLNEGFPTKSSCLPIGARVVIQVGNCQKSIVSGSHASTTAAGAVYNENDTKAPTGAVSNVWEVIRWRIKEHPRELANRLASLGLDQQRENSNGEGTNVNDAIYPNIVAINTSATSHDALKNDSLLNGKQQHQQNVILGSGASSCSTYLKVRGQAFELANQLKLLAFENGVGDGVDDHNYGDCDDAKYDNAYESTSIDNHYKVESTLSMSSMLSTSKSDKLTKTMFADYHSTAVTTAKSPLTATTNKVIKTTNDQVRANNRCKNNNSGCRISIDSTSTSEYHHGEYRVKANRAKIFASWVLNTFFDMSVGTAAGGRCGSLDDGARGGESNDGNEILSQSDATILPPDQNQPIQNNHVQQTVHVLDVAGGKGQLSLELILQQMSFLSSLSFACLDRRHSINGNGGSSSCKNDLVDAASFGKGDLSRAIISHCTIIDPMIRKGDAKQRQKKLKRARTELEWLKKRMIREKPLMNAMLEKGPQQHKQNSKVEIEKESIVESAIMNNDISEQCLSCNSGLRYYPDADMNNHNNESKGHLNPNITHIATHFTAQTFATLSILNNKEARPMSTSPARRQLPHQQGIDLNNQQQDSPQLLLLGLHPDQCTEDILDVALLYNVSFAIIPCCVFADMFPSRRRKPRQCNLNIPLSNINYDWTDENGTSRGHGHDDCNYSPVRTYNEFLQYLMDKDEGLQMATLPFDGKNIVIYKKVEYWA